MRSSAPGWIHAELRRRHADHVLALAEMAGPELRSAALRTWQLRLRREQENVRVALGWAIEVGEAEVGLRIAGAIWDYWHYWAELREGARWLEELLAMPAARRATPVRAKALRALAGVLYWQGDADRSFALYEEALSITRTLGDERLIAATLHDTAWAALGRDEFVLAIALAKESLAQYRKANDEEGATIVGAWLSLAPLITGHGGDVGAALDGAHAAIDANRRLGRSHEVADWLETLPLLYRAVGDFPRADVSGRESLIVWYELGTMGRLPLALKTLAAVALGMGQPERAVRLGAAADRYNDEIGGEVADVIAQLGNPVEEARPLLTAEEHARAVAEGRSMSLEEQVAYALE